jgi:D-alanyl-D-alanine carboxypeptidase (penicillin-binding protein 5/6)
MLFVDRMNERAKELGCEDTLFANCTGLPKEPQYSCAKDVATMLSALLKHPQYYEFGKIWTDTFHHPEGRTTEISNTNRLTRFYDGCDGGKTGFTNEAGFCLAATAKRGDMRVISVIIGAADSKNRFKQVAESFDYTFANYTMQTVVDESKEWENSVRVSGGKEKTVGVKPARYGRLFLRRGEKGEYELKTSLPSTLKAPIRQGDTVGEVYVVRDGVEVDRIPLLATATIDAAGYFDVLRDVANDWKIH